MWASDPHPGSETITNCGKQCTIDSQPGPLESPVLRLSKQQQTWGAVGVLAIALLFAFVLPPISQALEGDSGFTAGEAFPIDDGTSIVPANGWSLADTGQLLTTVSNGPATMAMIPAAPITQEPEAIIDSTIAGLENDPERQWVIGDPETYTTDAGYDVVAIEAHSSDTARRLWVIDNGEVTATFVGGAPEDLWVNYEQSMEDMAMSVRFTAAP